MTIMNAAVLDIFLLALVAGFGFRLGWLALNTIDGFMAACIGAWPTRDKRAD